MGKWLSIEEKQNAQTELDNNLAVIKEYRANIQTLQRRNERLKHYLNNCKKTNTQGMSYTKGECFEKYGKTYRQLNQEEKREYMRNRLRVLRSKK